MQITAIVGVLKYTVGDIFGYAEICEPRHNPLKS